MTGVVGDGGVDVGTVFLGEDMGWVGRSEMGLMGLRVGKGWGST